MRKGILIGVGLVMLGVVAASGADHRDGPLLCLSAGCLATVKTYTMGHYPGIPVVALKDLAKVAGATIDTKVIPSGSATSGKSLFRVEGKKLIVTAGSPTDSNPVGASQPLMVQCSGEISSKLIRHIGQTWVPVQDVVKALGATAETPLQEFRAGQTVRVSIRAGCDTCILSPR
jgi:hypothetical protein